MQRRIALCALAALLASPLVARAADPVAMPNAAETAFVTAIQADLSKRFATPKDAERAGYVRYTNEDRTGAISYANPKYWVSSDPKNPSQLWYDVNGRLLGADYSVLQSDHPTAPALFGMDPSRFHKVGAHIHYVVKNADGTFTYGKAIGNQRYIDAGLDPTRADAAGLVKAGAVTSPDQVAAVIAFPAMWDVSVWVMPNPDGAFADANPNVKPSKPASNSGEGH